MITLRRTFFGLFIFLLISTLVLAFAVPVLLPPGTDTQIGFYRSIPFKVILLLSLLLIIGWFWTFLSVRRMTLKRSARVLRQQVGQVFEERFEIYNNSRIGTLWMEVEDQSLIPGKQGSKVLSNFGRMQERSYITRTYLSRRGAFRLGPTILRSGDPFGIFSYTREFEEENTLLVLPMVVDIERFAAPAGFLPGGRALHQRSTEVTPHAAGVREYAPGDPLSRIHWKSTARRDKLMVKEFQQDPLADVWVFVDAHEAVHYNAESDLPEHSGNDPFWIWTHQKKATLPHDTFEYSVTIAASIANYFIRQGRSVGLAAAAKGLAVLPAERGERQLSKILETLAFLHADGRMPLVGLVEAQAAHLARGSTVVLVTSSVQESVVVAVDELMRRDIRPILVLVDPSSFGAPGSNAEIYQRIETLRIPTYQVGCGDSIQVALEGR